MMSFQRCAKSLLANNVKSEDVSEDLPFDPSQDPSYDPSYDLSHDLSRAFALLVIKVTDVTYLIYLRRYLRSKLISAILSKEFDVSDESKKLYHRLDHVLLWLIAEVMLNRFF